MAHLPFLVQILVVVVAWAIFTRPMAWLCDRYIDEPQED